MNHTALKKILLFLSVIMLCSTLTVQAQDADNNHFIYIQAKAKQPFYVILNKKIYSSSSIGYLIIPKLQDGSYDIRIGFPKEQAPEQNFTCVVNGGDAGYSLQKGDNGSLGLLNLQTKDFIASKSQTSLEDQYAVASPKVDKAKEAVSKTSEVAKAAATTNNAAFNSMLSDVANDPSLNKPIEQPKAVLPQPESKLSTQVSDFGANAEADSKAIAAAAASSENLKPAEQYSNDNSKTYGVIKSSQDRSRAGVAMTFIMFNSRSTDTVQILVPQNKTTAAVEETTGVAPEKISKKESLALFANTEADSFSDSPAILSDRQKARQEKRASKKFVNIDANSSSAVSTGAETGNVTNPFYDKSKDQSSDNDNAVQPAPKAAKPQMDDESVSANASDAGVTCDPLSEKDFSKMQKKMISRNNDNDMIAIVDKYIKGKCVTTKQVKQLGGLFLSDAGRYALFNDAYPNVSDKPNFPQLQDQLLDNYFKKRFQQILQ